MARADPSVGKASLELGAADPSVVWQPSEVSRTERPRGATVWFTGLPGSGKSTLAGVLERRLVLGGVPAYRLDGDNLRHGLNADLGFSPEDRAENVRRVAAVAELMADAGLVAIACLVSPYARGRLAARLAHQKAALAFMEVHVATPLSECARRDPKGLYARAGAGQLVGLTGVDAPYEAPEAPELRLSGLESVESALGLLLGVLASHGIALKAAT